MVLPFLKFLNDFGLSAQVKVLSGEAGLSPLYIEETKRAREE